MQSREQTTNARTGMADSGEADSMRRETTVGGGRVWEKKIQRPPVRPSLICSGTLVGEKKSLRGKGGGREREIPTFLSPFRRASRETERDREGGGGTRLYFLKAGRHHGKKIPQDGGARYAFRGGWDLRRPMNPTAGAGGMCADTWEPTVL
jgi:hypothetical protein